jgi:hypothetical protein
MADSAMLIVSVSGRTGTGTVVGSIAWNGGRGSRR